MRAEVKLLQIALDIEAQQPRQALRLYRRVRLGGDEFNWRVFLVGVASAVVAASAGFFVAGHLARGQTTVTVAFLLAGLIPMLWLRLQRAERRRGGRLHPGRTARWLLPVAAAAFVTDWLKIVAVGLTALFALVPLTLLLLAGSATVMSDPWSLDELLTMPWFIGFTVVLWVYLVLGYEIDVSSWRSFWLPWNAIPEMQAGLRERHGDVIGFFASFALGSVLVGNGTLGLLYEEYWQALVASAGTAVLLGLSAASLGEANEKLSVLRRLGEIRSSLRMGRIGAARWRLNELYGYAASLKQARGYFSAAGRKPSYEWLGPAIDVLGLGLYERLLERKPHLHVAMADQWVGASHVGDWDSAPCWEGEDWRSTLLDDKWASAVASAIAPYGPQWLTSVANSREVLASQLAARRDRSRRRAGERRISGPPTRGRGT